MIDTRSDKPSRASAAAPAYPVWMEAEKALNVEVDRPGGDPKEPLFFLTHGAGGDLTSAGLKAFSKGFAGVGHISVRMNLAYRAAGRKTPPAAEKSVEGFIETFSNAKEEFGPRARWVAGGRSYGGRVASMAAVDGLDAAGLIFFPYPLHRPGDPSHPRVEHWPDIKKPCLFVQGTKDPFCDMEVLARVLPALGGKATLLTVEGGDHSLRVRADKSAGKPARSEADVVAELMPRINDWIATL